jgi:phosphate regulon transcriptional regulator PhoB
MNPTGSQTIRILVVDDERDLVELVSYNLTKEGFKVSSASNGEEALDKIKKTGFDLIILDLMLPDIQGTELCRIIRSNPKTQTIPIIMLTAMSDVTDKIRGLETGADDYMTKPFSPKELIARVNAVLRRGDGKASRDKVISVGKLRIDKEQYTVSKGNTPLNLSATEFKLLLYLVERKGRVFSRDQLLDAVWDDDNFVEPRTVDVHIRRLRTQIEDDPSHPEYIKTRRGVGYCVDSEL